MTLTTVTVFCTASLLICVARAGEWIYTDTPSPRITHADTGWTLGVTADGTDITITHVLVRPPAPAVRPPDDNAYSITTHSVSENGFKSSVTRTFGRPAAPVALPLDDVIADSYRITALGRCSLNGCGDLVDVAIPGTVTNIDDSALGNNNALTNIFVAADCPAYRSIGGALFSKDGSRLIRCPAGKTATYAIPAGVTHIGDGAFFSCDKLAGVTIPASVTHIGNRTFNSCQYLQSVTIPASVTHIGDGAFASCNHMTNIVVDKANAAYRDIDGVLFSKDKKRLIQFPAGKREPYDIPTGVTHINARAFYDCGNISRVTIPASVIHIGRFAFYRRNGPPDNIVVAAGNPAYRSDGGVLFSKDGRQLVLCFEKKTGAYSIPAGVKDISDCAFIACHGLTGVTIPAGVTRIGDGAFFDCKGLTALTIPASVTEIYNSAFSCCDRLRDVTFDGECPVFPGKDDGYLFSRSSTNVIVRIHAAHTANWAARVTGSLDAETAMWQGRPVRVLSATE